MKALAFAAALAALCGFAHAQDMSLPPTYGVMDVPGGSGPYPHVTAIQSGGDVDAAHLGASCEGWIAQAPDLRVRYRGDRRLALVFMVRDNAATLVVNDATGAWHCTRGPLTITAPEVGRYDVWVAASRADGGARVLLEVSEAP